MYRSRGCHLPGNALYLQLVRYPAAKISRHSVAAWLYGVLRKKRINGAKAATPPLKIEVSTEH